MSQDDFKPKLGRMRDAGRARLVKHTTRVFRQAGKASVRALRQKGHVSPSALRRGMGAGVRAAAGLIAPGSRRVIVKARYTRIVGGDLGAARAHIRYILRDGVTREGMAGHLYDATHDEADGSAFLDRSGHDPHQFRFIVSPEDSARLADLKPFIRDLLAQMERDLETRLDWVAVDHSNTGHPHTHVVIRGRDDQGRDLVMARDYIAHGVRARAQGLITLELGPETESRTDAEALQRDRAGAADPARPLAAGPREGRHPRRHHGRGAGPGAADPEDRPPQDAGAARPRPGAAAGRVAASWKASCADSGTAPTSSEPCSRC